MEGSRAAVDLYWLPLGAGDGTHCVRWNGLVYERLSAWCGRRAPLDLYHAALEVRLGQERYVVEMAPVWSGHGRERVGVVEGPVGLPWLGRSRAFRYEVRCWREGTIPDRAYAVGGPQRLETDPERSARLLALAPEFPTATWGRDELGTGDMWSSNSLVSWLLSSSGHDVGSVGPPAGGRAPGWRAGLVAAAAGRMERLA